MLDDNYCVACDERPDEDLTELELYARRRYEWGTWMSELTNKAELAYMQAKQIGQDDLHFVVNYSVGMVAVIMTKGGIEDNTILFDEHVTYEGIPYNNATIINMIKLNTHFQKAINAYFEEFYAAKEAQKNE